MESGGGREDNDIDPAILYAAVPDVMPGERVTTEPGMRNARVMYVGQMPGMPAGYWIGVQYDEKVGKNDGAINGRRYFRCPPGHGGFLRPPKVHACTYGVNEKLNDLSRNTKLMANNVATPVEGGGEQVKRDDSPKTEEGRQRPLFPFEQNKEARRHQGRDEPQGPSEPIRRRAGIVMVPYGRSGSPADAPNAGPPVMPNSTKTPEEIRKIALAKWCAEKGVTKGVNDQGIASPEFSYATGTGLASATVGTLSQFSILATDGRNERIAKGGDHFRVVMRGKASEDLSQPALVRTKVTDRGDGTYMCEYRPWLTGSFSVHVTLDGCHVLGSPYELTVVTLRPDPTKCEVRGEALHQAVARSPAKFEILFVDAMGHPAQAEEIDVFVERVGGQGDQSPGGGSSSPEGGTPAEAVSTGSGDGSASPNRSPEGGGFMLGQSEAPERRAKSPPTGRSPKTTRRGRQKTRRSTSPRKKSPDGAVAQDYEMLDAPTSGTHSCGRAARLQIASSRATRR